MPDPYSTIKNSGKRNDERRDNKGYRNELTQCSTLNPVGCIQKAPQMSGSDEEKLHNPEGAMTRSITR